MTEVIGEVAKPFNFPEKICGQFVQIFAEMLERSPKLVASSVGHEFFLVFVCQAQIAGKYDRPLKRLLMGLKQRDTIDQSKRSVFYCLFSKILYSVADISEQRALCILSTTAFDIKKHPEVAGMPAHVSTEELARVIMLQKIIKLVHTAIMLIVNIPSRQGGFSRSQEEQAYSLMVEDFCRFALRRKQVYLLKLMPSLLHAGFIQQKTFDQICKSLTALCDSENSKLDEKDKELIRVNCLDSAKAKWSDKTKLKKEAAAI